LFLTLDVLMPGIDGWDVLCQLKADRELCDIPVVMVTVVDDQNLGLALGAADYLTKPIDRERLVAIAERYRARAAGPVSILVVDDDASTRSLMTRILSAEGYLVFEAEHGQRALEIVPECRPDLILLDLMMPVMDGFTFLVELGKLSTWRSTSVVIVTAKELTAEERAWLGDRTQQVLQKGSYGREQLLEQVRRIARERTGKPAAGQTVMLP
jgi:CheY-like chemotaxis protein